MTKTAETPRLRPLKGTSLNLLQKAIRKGEDAARDAMDIRRQRQEMELKTFSFRF